MEPLVIVRVGRGGVDLDRGVVATEEGEVALTAIEVALLRYLFARSGAPVGRAELLEEVWGYHPSVRSRAVDQTVKRLRKKIEADARDPSHLVSVPGVGYRFEPIPSEDVPLRTNLVAPPDRFFGQGTALRDLDRLIDEGARFVTVLGPGGIGKSRFAIEWGLRQRTVRWPGGVWFCDLVGIAELPAAERAIADALPGTGALSDRIAGLGRAVVILDGIEAAIDPIARRIAAWAAAAPAAVLVATSRHRTGARGEAGLELPALPARDARALFVCRADAVAGGATAGDEEGVDALVELLDGVPLAIELAAARVSLLSPAAIAARLARDSGVLGAGTRALGATLAWSWSLLSPREAALAGEIATAFRGGFSIEAAEAVLTGPAVLDGLQALRDRSWIQRRADGLLSMYAPIRSFAAERAPADLQLIERHGAYYVARAEEAATSGLAGAWRATGEIDRQVANLEAAASALAERDPDLAARAALATSQLLLLHPSAVPQRIALLDHAVGCAPSASPTHVRARRARAALRAWRGDVAGAEADITAGARLALDRGDAVEGCRMWAQLARALAAQGRTEEARALIEEARATPAIPDPTRVWLDVELAKVIGAMGDWTGARALLERAVASAPALGADGALPAYTLGFVAIEFGRWEEARASFAAALRWFDLHDPDRRAVLAPLPGVLAAVRGDAAAARAAFASTLAPRSRSRRPPCAPPRTSSSSGGSACWRKAAPRPRTTPAAPCPPTSPSGPPTPPRRSRRSMPAR